MLKLPMMHHVVIVMVQVLRILMMFIHVHVVVDVELYSSSKVPHLVHL